MRFPHRLCTCSPRTIGNDFTTKSGRSPHSESQRSTEFQTWPFRRCVSSFKSRNHREAIGPRSKPAIRCHVERSWGPCSVPPATTSTTRNVMTRNDLADRLVSLATAERDAVQSWIGEFEFPYQIAWLVEACRVMDYYH